MFIKHKQLKKYVTFLKDNVVFILEKLSNDVVLEKCSNLFLFSPDNKCNT